MSYHYHYQYINEDGSPLTNCPACGQSLTAPGGVEIHLSVAGKEFDVVSRLDPEGRLVDVDGAVAAGYLSCAVCAGCDEMLTDYECQIEEKA